MIRNISLGTTAVKIINKRRGLLCDFIIQNLSANNVYLVNSKSQTTSNGIKIVASGSYSDDKSDEELWIVADGANSDVRLRWNYYKRGSK